ncbi:hypothetical protein LCGC14_2940260 [marine sediment metagenome]|uniref:Uncharacterized protein n=1 Tax=marine sediment metagenome TaxID=412755 RepID=A0A0F8Y578_9ZZZZ
MKDWRVAVTGIIALGTIESIALMRGIDGIVLASVVGVIGLICGVSGSELAKRIKNGRT